MNILYNVGARNESENKTGFAHLFEHLMFGGSKNIPDFDFVLQQAGGYNNAYTTNDITNYYDVIPSDNIETLFWVESDRMLDLAFTPESLEIQRNVVIEEYKQRYLNQPYGDVWLLLHPLVYERHPYRWPTIGKDISHIEQATMDDVKSFFYKFYRPSNAILCVSGNVSLDEFERLCKKWFEPLPTGNPVVSDIPREPDQKEKKFLSVERQVPATKLYKIWKTPGLRYENFRVINLISTLLSSGNSSRLKSVLVKDKKIFTNIDAYIYPLIDDPAMFVISGTLHEGIKPEEAEKEIDAILNDLCSHSISDKELQKSKNRILTQLAFSNYSTEERAENLCFYEWLGVLNEFNQENELYESITNAQIQNESQKIFREEKSSVLYYLAKK
jgi:predicted Zn-dependent peptidase